MRPCHAVAAFLEPGFVRTHLPASDCTHKKVILPSWAYTAVGFREDRYWAAGFRVEDNPRWDPRNYDDRELIPAMEAFIAARGSSPLTEHLAHCATSNHCFAAKNLFLGRWEAPLPVSRTCNASCLGCLSLQPDEGCEASHQRISFRPTVEDIVSLAVPHLEGSERAIVSFGQGCEGEPLTEHALIRESVREIRRRTTRGTINLNTNGSMPDKVREIAAEGLDSIRISMNSARPDLYRAYYRPRGYGFEDVAASVKEAGEMGLYTMINLLVFPGVSDREAELEALLDLVRRTGVQFVHLKNLCIDPRLYLESMPGETTPAVGMRRMAEILSEAFPGLSLGYFNQPVRD
jgi:pyruvate-formate lyase-activating enzyme